MCRRYWGLNSIDDTGVDRVKGEGVGLHSGDDGRDGVEQDEGRDGVQLCAGDIGGLYSIDDTGVELWIDDDSRVVMSGGKED